MNKYLIDREKNKLLFFLQEGRRLRTDKPILGNLNRGTRNGEAIVYEQLIELSDELQALINAVNPNPTTNRINSGGIVSVDGTNPLQINVTAVNYDINDTTYNIATTSNVILSAGDSTYDRVDAIVLTIVGVAKIEGTPSATPVSPVIPSDNILLSYIDVPANATSLSINGTVLTVSTLGNDATAERGNALRPYRTIDYAQLVAQPGDIIDIFGGRYDLSGSIGKNLITYNFRAGSKIYYNPGIDTVMIGDINYGGSAITFWIKGQGEFYYTSTVGRMFGNLGASYFEIEAKLLQDSNTNGGLFASARVGSGATLIVKNTRWYCPSNPVLLSSSSYVSFENCELVTDSLIYSKYLMQVRGAGGRTIIKNCKLKNNSNSEGTIQVGQVTGGGTLELENSKVVNGGTASCLDISTADSITFIGYNIFVSAGSYTWDNQTGSTKDILNMGWTYRNVGDEPTDAINLLAGTTNDIISSDVTYSIT